jgi:hypothetical protein
MFIGNFDPIVKLLGIVIFTTCGIPISVTVYNMTYMCMQEYCIHNKYYAQLQGPDHSLLICKTAKTKEEALNILQKTIKNDVDPIDITDFDEMTLPELQTIIVVGDHGYTAKSIRDLIAYGKTTSPLNPTIPLTETHYYTALAV